MILTLLIGLSLLGVVACNVAVLLLLSRAPVDVGKQASRFPVVPVRGQLVDIDA